MKKIAFIMPGFRHTASNRYRFTQYEKYFNRDGFKTDFFWPYTKEMNGVNKANIISILINIIKIYKNVIYGKYEKVFIQRHILHPSFPLEYFVPKKIKKKLILDIDDSVFLINPKKYNLILKSVSIIIAGNKYLMEYCSKINNKVVIIPTSVELKGCNMDYDSKNKSKHSFRLGWVGSPSGLVYLNTITKGLTELNKIIPIRLVVISDFTKYNKIKIDNVEVESIQWVEKNEYDYYSLFDVGILPLNKYDEFILGKCSFKAIQYMANKVPVLASNLGNNSRVIQNGINGYLYNDDNDFISKVLEIKSNQRQIKKIIENAYNDVCEYYSVEKNYPKYKTMIIE